MGSISTFKEKLDKEHQWPDQYMFKFVIPVAKSQELTDLFEGETLEKKHSKAGNYVSITMKKLMNSSDDVIAVYQQANKIEGLIML
ncbi:MAG: DUF493 domain-containing protein [Cyclobacteriaceae bacterium]|nr:DUF493 domain-containing protein [Cyclobacteriaceae bacterium]